MNHKGFSLIELVIAISIMTVIMGIALPAVSAGAKRQKIRKEIGELNLIREGIEHFFEDTFAFPDEIEDLLADSGDFDGWAGPYYNPGLSTFGSGSTSPTQDEWKVDYQVKNGGFSTYSVTSSGPDRDFGTDDDIAAAVDVTYIRREKTLGELAVINKAILSYNAVYIGSDPLLPDWLYIHQKLIDKGYLPAGDDTYEKDAWDELYDPDPSGSVPVVRVKSVMIQ